MEDVLALYHQPYHPQRPQVCHTQVCLDETSKELHGEVREPLATRPDASARQDYEYVRHDTANLFLWFEPLSGRRHLKVTQQRTRRDFAYFVRELVDVHYPTADRIVLVLDSLETHTLGSLYETFPAPEARRLAEKLELHHTPKHGSWMNMAEIELSILTRQCLRGRFPDREALARAAEAWTADRNRRAAKMEWRFATAEARIKLKRLYPTLQSVTHY